MDPIDRARLVVAIEDRYRAALLEALPPYTLDPAEQQEIASAVLALLLKKMYHVRGTPWLEAVLKMVLTDDTGPSSSPVTSPPP